MKLKKLLYPLLLLLLSVFINGEIITKKHNITREPVISTHYGGIESVIRELEGDKSLYGSLWSLCAYNISKGEYLAERNKELLLVPASVMKIVTTISAYELLGQNSVFTTYLNYSGKIFTDSVLHGNIIIKGSGDPTIDCDFFGMSVSADNIFTEFKNALTKAGIKSVKGKIIGDGSLWGSMFQAPGYMWEDIGNYYGAGTSSLNYSENKLKITFKSGKHIGDIAEVLFITGHPCNLVWINEVTTAGAQTGDNVYIYGAPFQNIRFMTGSIPAGRDSFSIWASDPDPAHRIAYDFYKFLKNTGIHVSDSCFSEYRKGWANSDTFNVIYTHESPAIGKILQFMNEKSHNVSAESIFRYTGMKVINNPSFEETAKYLTAYWQNKTGSKGIIIRDGSGLSRTNMISAEFMVDLLVYAQSQPWFNEFYAVLPVAGQGGSLRNAFKNTSAENNMRGKTGTMKGIRCYAGYVYNKSDDLVAFCLMMNSHTLSSVEIRKKLEKLIVAISNSY